MDEGYDNDEKEKRETKEIKFKEKEKQKLKKERSLSPITNPHTDLNHIELCNSNQKEISAKMKKILSIMYDDNFVLMINELSSSIKQFHKESNQNFLDIKQNIYGQSEDNEILLNIGDLNINKDILKNIDIKSMLKNINNIQNIFTEFYSKAKIVFKKMKIYRNEKLKSINESALELQNNKFLKLCFVKNNKIEKKEDKIEKINTADLISENSFLKKKVLLLERHVLTRDNTIDYNDDTNNILKESVSHCVSQKVLITDIKLLLNILQLEKLTSYNNDIGPNNKTELFNKKEDLIKKINQEIDEISDKNILNNINPYISNNNIILSNNNINNNNYIQNGSSEYEKEKNNLLNIIEDLKKENKIIKDENDKYLKMNESLTSKLNKMSLKLDMSSKLEAKKHKEEIEKYYEKEIEQKKDEFVKQIEKIKKDLINIREENKRINKQNI